MYIIRNIFYKILEKCIVKPIFLFLFPFKLDLQYTHAHCTKFACANTYTTALTNGFCNTRETSCALFVNQSFRENASETYIMPSPRIGIGMIVCCNVFTSTSANACTSQHGAVAPAALMDARSCATRCNRDA